VYGSLAIYRKQAYTPSEQVLAFVDRASQFLALLFALKETRTAVAKSEQLHRSIVQLNTDMIIRYNKEFRIQLVNDALCTFFGTNSSSLIGKSMLELLPEVERESLKQSLSEILERRTDYKELRRTELGPDQIRYVEWVSMPIADANGQIEGIQAVGRDVTALKLAEERVQRNEHLLKSINANVQDGIYRSEVLTGRILYANKAFLHMFGYDTVAEIPGQSTRALYANAIERDTMIAQAEPGQLFDNEERLLKKSNGQTFWGMFSCVVSATPEGILLYDGVIKDTTELRKAEQKIRQQNSALKKLNAELDRFVYSVSHNLRSPLASLLGLINILKAEPNETMQLLPMMESSIHKLDDFIKDLIAYSKNARVQLQPQPITIHALCTEIIDSLRFMEGASRVEVRLDIPMRLSFMSDLSRLKLILENLITNSFKYHNPHIAQPWIRIDAREDKETLHISVEDNGLGIDAVHLEHVFKMFYRANDKVQGSGLGLFIVKEAVDRLGGSIQLQSEVNKGTCFTLMLPSLSSESIPAAMSKRGNWEEN
jgi:PAS domain S-box-containing protein